MADTHSAPFPQRWVLDPGPYASHIDAYRCHLFSLDYQPRTVLRYELAARHFCCWLHVSDGQLTEVGEADLDRFRGHDCRCAGARRRGSAAPLYLSRVRKFIRFLAGSDVIKVDRESKPAHAPGVAAWLDWLRRHKGLAVRTLDRYELSLGKLLPLIGTDPALYDASNLRSAFLDRCSSEGPSNRQSMAKALRSWLRYNAALDRCPTTLAAVLPPVVRTRPDNVPRGLTPAEVNRLLAACDTGTAIGRRDFAVLLLVARLGLRAGEVRSLTFDQIDWRRGCPSITGKGRREAKMPLPQDVGDAILAWLEDGRPPLDDPHVFLCMRPPWRPFAGTRVVAHIVARALDRAGLKDTPSRGAHLLRHSVGRGLIEEGVTLETIATLLRHRSIETTSIYAKADHGRLREIAQPWPGGAS